MRIAFLACAETLPGGGERRGDAYEHDLQVAALRPAIEARSGSLTEVDWRAPVPEFADFDLVLLGTAWDYHDHAAEFLAQLEAIEAGGTIVCNPPALVRWNIDKRYLRDLAAQGATTIPTLWIDDPVAADIEAAFTHFDADRIVVKRQVGAGAVGQQSFTKEVPPPPDWRMGHAAMIQPFLPAIESEGEFSFIFVDADFSHAVRKTAAPDDYRIQSLYGGREQTYAPTGPEIERTANIVRMLPGATPLYARIDMVRGDDGALLLMEAEAIEPYLYPEQGSGLGEAMAAMIGREIQLGGKKPMLKPLLTVLAVALITPAHAQDRGTDSSVDPLTVEVGLADADRFAELFEETNGAPTAAEIEARYLKPGTRALTVFTPNRIANADNMADSIAASPELYREAIDRCLPIARTATGELRSIYLALHGALPNARLPQVHIVFGANNSGGTAVSGIQVLGLEVLCRETKDEAELRSVFRRFFAHETIHALQEDAGIATGKNGLLRNVLSEGAADFIARLVTGQEPDLAREAWARPRQMDLWQQFERDIATTHDSDADFSPDSPNYPAIHRWVGNFGSAPDEWPGELGYWIGLQIWDRYYARAEDKRQALQDMLEIKHPEAIYAAAIP